MFHKRFPLWDENDGNNGGSSGSGDDISALKDEISRLRNHSSKLLDEKKQIQESLKRFDGIDPENVKKMMSVLESSEEAKLLAENKLDEVVNKRTEKLRIDSERLKSEFDEYKAESEKKNNDWKQKYAAKVIETELRREAEKAKVVPEAIDDVISRARGIFSLDEDGKIEARDSDGNIITVKKKALNPEVFISQLKETAPHFWPKSQGAGASGGTGNGGMNEVNPFIPNTPGFSLTEQSKLMNSDPEKARMFEQAAKAYVPPTKQ